MKIDIYQSAINGEKYLTVAKGTKLDELKLPADFDPELLRLSPFKTRLEIDPTKSHPTLDHQDVLAQINASGYAIHGAKNVIILELATTETQPI